MLLRSSDRWQPKNYKTQKEKEPNALINDFLRRISFGESLKETCSGEIFNWWSRNRIEQWRPVVSGFFFLEFSFYYLVWMFVINLLNCILLETLFEIFECIAFNPANLFCNWIWWHKVIIYGSTDDSLFSMPQFLSQIWVLSSFLTLPVQFLHRFKSKRRLDGHASPPLNKSPIFSYPSKSHKANR